MLRDTKILEPRVGVEPTTCRLRIGCSTTELPRPLILKDLRLPVKQSENFALFLPCSLPEFRRFVASILIRERVALPEPLSPITSRDHRSCTLINAPCLPASDKTKR